LIINHLLMSQTVLFNRRIRERQITHYRGMNNEWL